MKGFPELEWFDSSPEQMLAHASFWAHREDDDFTDMDRFFTDRDPENVDASDFYTDRVQ